MLFIPIFRPQTMKSHRTHTHTHIPHNSEDEENRLWNVGTSSSSCANDLFPNILTIKRTKKKDRERVSKKGGTIHIEECTTHKRRFLFTSSSQSVWMHRLAKYEIEHTTRPPFTQTHTHSLSLWRNEMNGKMTTTTQITWQTLYL